MLTLIAFLVAITLLVAVHEWGHFSMARWCGVKVLRFSIGMGKVLWKTQLPKSQAEFVICMLPIGGYVRMLDEREGEVATGERQFAFNVQPLHKRAAIVAAGPLANLLLAVLLYSMVNWIGLTQPQAIISEPPSGSVAAMAGLRSEDQILAARLPDQNFETVKSFDELRWLLTQSALEHQNLDLQVKRAGASGTDNVTLVMDSLDTQTPDAQLFQSIGIVAPHTDAVIGDVLPDGAAMAAGLQKNDRVMRADGIAIYEAMQLRNLIRESARSGDPGAQKWLIDRNGHEIEIRITPRTETESGKAIGRVGAMIGSHPATTVVRYGPVQGVVLAVQRTWDVSKLSMQMMWRMVIGEASLKSISGPITIADYAGRSASLGVTEFLLFLALISVSLGALNLLPLPILDGGYLLYYAWEAAIGRPVSQKWESVLQRAGMAVLLLLMFVALFNDITRLMG